MEAGKVNVPTGKGKTIQIIMQPIDRKVIKHVHFHSYPEGVGCAEITSCKNKEAVGKKYKMDLGVAVQATSEIKDCSSGSIGTMVRMEIQESQKHRKK